MSNDWYVKLDGKTDRGPLSSDALRRLAQQGRVTPDTPVKKGQAGAWHRANDVHGLFAEPSGQSTPATAKPSSKPASSAAISTTKPQSVLPRAVPPNAPPPPPSEQVGEMAASRIGRVAPPTPVAESPSAALAEAVARREDQTGIALPAPRQGRISTQLSRKERDFAPSLIYLAIGAIVLVAVTVGATFWATGFLARSQSAGVDSSATLGKNSNSAETAQSPAPSPAPSAPTPKINYVVKGEIFVTTKGVM